VGNHVDDINKTNPLVAHFIGKDSDEPLGDPLSSKSSVKTTVISVNGKPAHIVVVCSAVACNNMNASGTYSVVATTHHVWVPEGQHEQRNASPEEGFVGLVAFDKSEATGGW